MQLDIFINYSLFDRNDKCETDRNATISEKLIKIVHCHV